jgi:site-specific DNA-adenine methylase
MDKNISKKKPLLKWVGGKTHILDVLIKYFPKKIKNYHEIFVGGGSVLLHYLSALEEGHFSLKGKIYAYDLNEPLIALYRNIQSNHLLLYNAVLILREEYFSCDYQRNSALPRIVPVCQRYARATAGVSAIPAFRYGRHARLSDSNRIACAREGQYEGWSNANAPRGDKDGSLQSTAGEVPVQSVAPIQAINRVPKNKVEAMQHKENYFYWVRSQYNKLSDLEKKSIQGSAMFLFLNKTCFRGLFRLGPNGFNVPYGHYKNPTIIDWEHIEEIHHLIQKVQFICSDFNTSLKNIRDSNIPSVPAIPAFRYGRYGTDTCGGVSPPSLRGELERSRKATDTFSGAIPMGGSNLKASDDKNCAEEKWEDFIYMDPPYASDKKSSFVGYTKDGFNENQHIELFNLCHELTNKKVKWMMSNADVCLIRNHFFPSVSPPSRGRIDFLPTDLVSRTVIGASSLEGTGICSQFPTGDCMQSLWGHIDHSKIGPYYAQKVNVKRFINSKNPAMKAKELIIINHLIPSGIDKQ